MGTPADRLAVQIPVSVQHRGAEAPQRHAVEARARVHVQQVVLELLVFGGRGGRDGGVRPGGSRRRRPSVVAVRVAATTLRSPAEAAAAAGGLCALLSAAGRVLVEAERVAGVRRAAERRAGRHHHRRRGADAQTGRAAPENVNSLGLLGVGYLLGCRGDEFGLVERVMVVLWVLGCKQ